MSSSTEPTPAEQPPIAGYATRLGVDQVDLFVGPEKRHFRVSKAMLCSKIPYFDKMFNGGFKEALEYCATFPEDCSNSFELLIEWVYTGSYKQFVGKHPQTMAPEFVAVYCLAEKFCVPDLADYSMNSLRAEYILTTRHPLLSVVEYAYNNSAPGSCLRRYMAESMHVAMKICHPEHDPDGILAPEVFGTFVVTRIPDLLQDIIVLMRSAELAEHAAGSRNFVLNPEHKPVCDYHQHAADEPCKHK